MVPTRNIIVLLVAIIFIVISAQNSTADDCRIQLENIGKLNMDFDTTNIFVFVYYNITENIYKKNDILLEYLEHFYDAVMSVWSDVLIQSPLYWCVENIANYKTSYIGVSDDGKRKRCTEYFRNTGFDNNIDAQAALKFAFFKMTLSKQRWNTITKEYYNYMLRNIKPKIAETKAVTPKFFCENINSFLNLTKYYIDCYYKDPCQERRKLYSYSKCTESFNKFGKLDINFNGIQAFTYAYFHISSYEIILKKFGIIRQYFNFLYNSVTSNYAVNTLQDPNIWCMDHMKKLYKTYTTNQLKSKCEVSMSEIYLTFDAEAALRYSYFHIKISSKNLSNTTVLYIEYIADTINASIDQSHLIGPHQYCFNTSVVNDQNNNLASGSHSNDFNTLTANTFTNNQQSTVNTVFNQSFTGQVQKDLEQYIISNQYSQSFFDKDNILASGSHSNYFNTSSADTFVNNQHNTVLFNQSSIDQVQPGTVGSSLSYDFNTGYYIPLTNTLFNSQNTTFAYNLPEISQNQSTEQYQNNYSYDPNIRTSTSSFLSTSFQDHYYGPNYKPSD